jgi:uncharacterized membrane protein
MPKRAKKEIKKNGKDDTRLFAFLATFLSIIGFFIAIIARKEDRYVMFYAKQSLIVFIVSAILSIIAKVLLIIPIVGVIIYAAVSIITLILWLLSWIYALSGKEKEVPIIGEYAKLFKF